MINEPVIGVHDDMVILDPKGNHRVYVRPEEIRSVVVRDIGRGFIVTVFIPSPDLEIEFEALSDSASDIIFNKIMDARRAAFHNIQVNRYA